MGAMVDRSIAIQTCASVHFRITAINIYTRESVTLCGENRAPVQPLPEWEVERQQKKGFFEAIKGGDLAMIRRELESGADVNADHADYRKPPLMFAVVAGQVEAARLLLDAKADVSQKEDLKCHRSLQFAACNEDEDVAMELTRLLIEKNADVNQAAKFDTPLISAATFGHLQVMQLLLENRADANQQDPYHELTVLHVVAGNHDRSFGIAKFLVENRAKFDVDINKVVAVASFIKPQWSHLVNMATPLDRAMACALTAADSNKLVALLEAAGAVSAKELG